MPFKTTFAKRYLNIALSKNVFQKDMSNCHLKIAPSKYAFQNCYKLSIGNKNQNSIGLKTLDM